MDIKRDLEMDGLVQIESDNLKDDDMGQEMKNILEFKDQIYLQLQTSTKIAEKDLIDKFEVEKLSSKNNLSSQVRKPATFSKLFKTHLDEFLQLS